MADERDQEGRALRRPPLLSSLSERELQVLASLAFGAGNQEIAEELLIAPSTVKTHIEHIYKKLGVKNRTAAAAHFFTAKAP